MLAYPVSAGAQFPTAHAMRAESTGVVVDEHALMNNADARMMTMFFMFLPE
jgi:hypothetical protein